MNKIKQIYKKKSYDWGPVDVELDNINTDFKCSKLYKKTEKDIEKKNKRENDFFGVNISAI